jgi:hypothetical protein
MTRGLAHCKEQRVTPTETTKMALFTNFKTKLTGFQKNHELTHLYGSHPHYAVILLHGVVPSASCYFPTWLSGPAFGIHGAMGLGAMVLGLTPRLGIALPL